MQKSFLNVLKLQLERNVEIFEMDFYRKTRLNWKNILRYKHQFERVFNIFPFLWFGYLFLTTSGYFSRIIYHLESRDIQLHLSKLIVHLLNLVFAFGVIFFESHLKGRLSEDLNLVCDLLIRKQQSKNIYDVIQCEKLRDELLVPFNYTGRDMFNLNKGFVMSFLGALITFTVMFLQLSTS